MVFGQRPKWLESERPESLGAIFASFFAVPSADLTNADLTGANLSNTVLPGSDAGLVVGYRGFRPRSTTSGLVFSTISTPQRGLTFKPSPEGDFDANDLLGASRISTCWPMDRTGPPPFLAWLDAMFDLNSDGSVDHEDHRIWVKDLKHTWFGDANLDGEFNSSDMVQVFAAGKYETSG